MFHIGTSLSDYCIQFLLFWFSAFLPALPPLEKLSAMGGGGYISMSLAPFTSSYLIHTPQTKLSFFLDFLTLKTLSLHYALLSFGLAKCRAPVAVNVSRRFNPGIQLACSTV